MDLANLARVADARTRMLILCSPHNPVGRVWEPEELGGVGVLLPASLDRS